MIPFKDKAADHLKRTMATWSALFAMLFFIIFWILTVKWLKIGVDNPQLTILNLILSSLAGLQCFILLIAAKRGEALAEQTMLHIKSVVDKINTNDQHLDKQLKQIKGLLEKKGVGR